MSNQRGVVVGVRSLVMVGVLSCVGGAASAGVTLSAAMTADNLFTASVSTSATDGGTPFLAGNSWPTTYTGSAEINIPGTYYLHVFAQDVGRPAMFIGNFGLSEGGAFADGSQTLVTDASTGLWSASLSGFGGPSADVIDLGPRGSSPWGNLSSSLGDARFIWADDPASSATPLIVYFRAEFTVVPAPGVLAAFGAFGMAARRRR